MNIDLARLSKMAAGVVACGVKGGAWYGQRIPDVMHPLYLNTDAARVRLLSTAGVRVRFRSNTRHIQMALRYGTGAREIFRGSMVVDGQLAKPFGAETPTQRWAGCVFRQEEAKHRLFDLWLPNMCETHIESMEVDDGCEVSLAPGLVKRWLVYGDSITQGMVCSQPAMSVIGRCTLALGVDTINLGVGGAKLEAALAQTVPDVECNVISIAYGTNDMNQGITPADFGQRGKMLLAALTAKYPKQPIVLITPLTWVGRDGDLEGHRAALREAAAAYPTVRIVEGGKLIPDDDRYFVDKVHPNDDGFALYAQELLKVLKECV